MASTVHLLGANDLHGQVTAHNPKRVFGTSSSSDSEVLEPQVLERQSVHTAAAETGQD